MRKFLLVTLILASLLTGCLPVASTRVPTATATTTVPTAVPTQTITAIHSLNPNWWDDTVFYEIFVRSFYDSNGDGIGDFNGVTEKLDYLASLGVSGIWLMPIFPSPSYHGYDVTDFYSVNPQYGTMEDFRNLLDQAHQRGIHVIIDLVLNHTSDQHPWFKSAKKNVNSPYRNWYIWSETDPKYKGPWGESVWYPTLTGYYYGIFESFMPDLNYNNPAVTQEMDKIVTYWLKDVGVDGFRLDAAKHLIENGSTQQNTAATHQWYANFRPVYKAVNPQAITVGEISGDPPSVLASYTNGSQLDLVFDFGLANAFVNSANGGQAAYAVNALETSIKLMPNFQFAPFLTNHDQNRVMSDFRGDMNKARVAASLLLTSPGTPFIYYGEEIGMVGMKPDENIRRPIQWSDAANAGFTTGKPWRPTDAGYAQVNVESESADPNSLWSHYQMLIKIRNEHPALRTGAIEFFQTENPQLYATLRSKGDEFILTLINLGKDSIQDYDLELSDTALPAGTYTLTPLMGDGNPSSLTVETNGSISKGKPLEEIPPYSTYIFQLSQ